MSLSWLQPMWGWLLLALPGLLLLLLWSEQQRTMLRQMWWGSSPLKPSARPCRIRTWLWLPMLLCFVLAAMGPAWGLRKHSPLEQGRSLVIILDVSRSMNAMDDRPQSRLDRARAFVHALLNDLRDQERRDRVGIILFAGQARWLSPLTTDYDHLQWALAWATSESWSPSRRLSLKASTAGKVGTDLDAGLKLLHEGLSPKPHRDMDLLYISDGDELAPSSATHWVDELFQTGITTHVLAMGHPTKASRIPSGNQDIPFLSVINQEGQPIWVTSRCHFELLEPIAKAGRGSFLHEPLERAGLVRWYRDQIGPKPGFSRTGDDRALLIPRYQGFLLMGILGLAMHLWLWPRMNTRNDKPREHATQTQRQNGTENPPRQRLAITLAGCVTLLLGGLSLANAPAQKDALLQAKQAYEQGRLEDALVHLQLALQQSTDPGRIAYQQGLIAVQLQRYAQAANAFQCTLEDAEGLLRVRALIGYAHCQGQLGRQAQGPVALTTIKEADQTLQKAEALLQQLSHDDAVVEQLRSVVRHDREVLKQWLAQKSQEPVAPEAVTPPTPTGPDRPPQESAWPDQIQPTPQPQQPNPEDPRLTDELRPGRGDLPLIFGTSRGEALSPAEAAAVLQDQLKRMAQQRQKRAQGPTQMPNNERDW